MPAICAQGPGPLYKLDNQGRFLRAATGATLDEMIARALPNSLIIFGFALLAGTVAGVLLGLLVSRFTPRWLRSPAGAVNLVLLSFPDVLRVLLVQFGLINFGQYIGFEPFAPYADWQGNLTLHTAVFPILILSLFPAAYLARVAAAAFDEIFPADYVRTARAKGLSGWRIVKDHAMRNGLIPILGGLPSASALTISNLIIIEYLTNTGGLGWLLAQEFQARSGLPSTVAAVAICLAVLFVLIDGLVDLFLFWLDPKAREARRQEESDRRARLVQPTRSLPKRPQWLGRREAPAAKRPPVPAPGPVGPVTPEPFPWRWYLRNLGNAYRGNLPLILGTLIVGILVLVALLDPLLTPRDPYQMQPLLFKSVKEFSAPPFEPGPEFPLGSDELGRDMLSRVIHGTRFTLLFVLLTVPLRILIALPVGLAAGWLRGGWEFWVSRIATIFGAVPTLVLSAMLVPLVFVRPLEQAVGSTQTKIPPEAYQILAMHLLVLVVLGWPRLAESIRLMTREQASRSFIEGATAVGAQPWRVMRRHILPHLLPSLAVMGAAEIAWLMMLLTQLGVFGIALGGHMQIQGVGAMAVFPDWSTMLSKPLRYFWARHWILVTPALAFFMAILGLNLLAEGLRRANQRLSVPAVGERPTARPAGSPVSGGSKPVTAGERA